MADELQASSAKTGAGTAVRLRVKDVLIIGWAALVLGLPVLIYGPMAGGHDTYQHLSFKEHFVQQFWSGDCSPRWLLGMNHGLGSPSFFVYPPFPFYIVALLEPAGKELHFNTFNVMEFLALFGSGISAGVWLGTMASRRVAIFVSILFMLMPYHLTADFYRRTALAECWALVWIPAVFYFTTRLWKPDRAALIGLAVTYGLMILSHLISVGIISLLPLAMTIFLSPRGQKVRSSIRVAAGMLLGSGLASFYLVPALFHSRYISVTRMISVYPFFVPDNLIQFGSALLHGRDFIHTISLIVINMMALIVTCAAVVLRKKQTPEQRTNLLFWIGVSALTTFLMTSWSLSIWNALPLMHRIAQFPWRLNIVLCVAALPIMATFLSYTSLDRKWNHVLPMMIFSLIIFSWLVSYGAVWRLYQTEVTTEHNGLSDGDDAFTAWSVPGTDQASALKASSGPRARFLSGNGDADVLVWKPRHLKIETNSPTGGMIMINQFYYPTWTATLLGGAVDEGNGGRPLPLSPAIPEGLLQLQTPPGHQEIRLDIPLGSAEIVGRWVTLLCILLCGVLAVWNKEVARAFSL